MPHGSTQWIGLVAGLLVLATTLGANVAADEAALSPPVTTMNEQDCVYVDPWDDPPGAGVNVDHCSPG